MNRFRRYWNLWQTLPPDDRRERVGRLVERLFRQRPAVRRLGLVPDQPRWSEFRRALHVSPSELVQKLRRADPRRGPLFAEVDGRVAEVADRRPEHAQATIARARTILDGQYDLLGSGPTMLKRSGGSIDWHLDWKSGLRWPEDVYYVDLEVVRGDGSDVKVPWELARFQHLLVLAQACHFAPRVLGAAEAAEMERRCTIEVREQIDDWIEHNPRGLGIHWCCAMEVAIRSVVWLACLALLRHRPELDDDFVCRLVRSLWVHGRHIRRNLEIASDGATSNHYLSNVIGLYALGCALPELRDAEGWRVRGRDAVVEEMERQVHPDGVDFERSIPYHRLVTEIFLHGLLLARGAGDELPGSFEQRLARMLEFVAAYTRPDGSVPQWGDNDDGRLLPLCGYASAQPNDHRHLLALGGRALGRDDLAAGGENEDVEALWLLGVPSVSGNAVIARVESRGFPDAGCYIMRDRDLHSLVPCGAVGTDGIGNHSHNDLLSICIWAGGVEWITDPGTGGYTGDPALRNRMRATAVHATLQLGDREQNVFGRGLDGLFRLEERARPGIVEWSASERRATLVARHRGYAPWVHERAVWFDGPRRMWRMLDSLRSEAGDALTEETFLRYPLCPRTRAELQGEDVSCPPPLAVAVERDRCPGQRVFAVRLVCDKAELWMALLLPDGSRIEIEESRYSPRYGVTLESRCVAAVLPARLPIDAVTLIWSPRT